MKGSATDILTTDVLGPIAGKIAGVNLPVAQVKDVTWVDFTDTTSARGGFKFTLALSLGDGLDWLPDLTVENVVLRTNGVLDLGKDADIEAGPLSEPIIPIGPTNFVLTGHRINTVGHATGTLETEMVPAEWQGDPTNGPVRFHLEIALNLPLTEIQLGGTMYMGQDAIGSLQGR